MIVLVGASGYIGQAFARHFSEYGVAYQPLSRRELNYYNGQLLREWLCKRRPDFLINAAGFTGRPNVDACELHKAECLLANAVLPGIIRAACESLKLPWGHVSTGCIYLGTRPDGGGFRESDSPNFTFRHNNCSFYSGCKALGEEMLEGATACYIWRLRMPFSHVNSPRNYLTKLLTYDRLLDARNSLSSLDEFVAACYQCWYRNVEYGTYHMTNTGSVTTREVIALINQHGLATKHFQFFESEADFMRQSQHTPRSICVLDNSKVLHAGLHLSEVRTALELVIRKWSTK